MGPRVGFTPESSWVGLSPRVTNRDTFSLRPVSGLDALVRIWSSAPPCVSTLLQIPLSFLSICPDRLRLTLGTICVGPCGMSRVFRCFTYIKWDGNAAPICPPGQAQRLPSSRNICTVQRTKMVARPSLKICGFSKPSSPNSS